MITLLTLLITMGAGHTVSNTSQSVIEWVDSATTDPCRTPSVLMTQTTAVAASSTIVRRKTVRLMAISWEITFARRK